MSRRILLPLALIAASVASARDKPENWLEVRSQHFIVLTDSNEKQARHVAEQFERMRLVFHAELPQSRLDPGTPIIVLAVKDKKDFQALEPEVYLAKGQIELAGLFLRAPDKNYILLRLDAQGEHPYATVYHEYKHLLSSRSEEWMPLWLNEGWAEFFQNTEIRDKKVLLGEASPENIYFLRQQRMLPLGTLLTVDRKSPYYHEENRGSIFYAESWALTHYLWVKDAHDNTRRLTEYEELVSQKIDAVTAATRAFGDLNKLQAALEKYVTQDSFRYFPISLSTDVDDTTFTVRTLSPSQTDAARADFLAYDERVKDAQTLLETVLRDDPKNVSAHETMGYLEFRRGHLDEARKWYEQAVKLDSQSFVANYYFAAIAINGGPLNVATKLQVVNSLRTAIKLNPSFAPAYDQLAVFFAMQRENLEEAHTLALNAVQLDPGNLRYRLNTANILLEMERGPDAITVLQNAMSLAKTPAEVASVQNLMEEARQYQAAREQSEQERQPGHGIQPTVPQGESAPQAPPSSEQNEPSGTNPSRPEPSQPDTAKAGNGCDLKPATASYGPLELLTETKGVDFGPYLQRVVHDVRNNWYNLIPQQARAPLMKKGKVSIEFAILKNGTVSGMKLTSTSGDVALDRGAWGSIATSSPFQPLPSAFSGEYLGVRFTYFYNPTAADLGDQTTARGKKAAFGDKRGNGDNSTLLLPCVTTAIRMVGEVGVAMVPTAPQVASGEKQQFVALLTGETNSWIYWTVSGAGCSGSACGSISQEGLYTAPSVIPNPASVLVTATLATETGETASTTVTIVPPTGSR